VQEEILSRLGLCWFVSRKACFPKGVFPSLLPPAAVQTDPLSSKRRDKRKQGINPLLTRD